MIRMDTADGQRVARGPAALGAPLPLLLLVLAAVTEAVARAAVGGGGGQAAQILTAGLVALFTTVPLLVLGPIAAAVAVSAAHALSFAVFQTPTVAGAAAQVICLYRLGRTDTQREYVQVLAMILAAPFVGLALASPHPGHTEAGFLSVLLASAAPATAWAGIAQRARSEAQVHNAARQSIAHSLREHTARGERARIARELHDVVAHHISMIAVQAETARLTTPGMPAAGAQRLSEIGDTARAGLTEMRRLLGVLREDAQAAAAERRPQPGLQQLNELIDEARAASGAGTRLIVSGTPATLDPGVELAAYRIIQEALTNARRHAPGAAVDVELRYTDEDLRLRIRDNGPGPAPDAQPGGHGLPGMRERASAAGGELHVGAAAGGGFLIEAVLPVKAEEAE
jgi:signal transduction histidine kinase